MIKKFLLLGIVFFNFGSAQAAEKVSFCRPNNMVSALSYIADNKGFFKDEGLDMTFVTASNAKLCQDALLSNSADIMNGGDGPFTYMAASNPDVSLLAVLGKIPEVALFARKDHGIQNPQDLKGKKVGWLPGTVSYFYAARWLEKNHLSMSDINWVSLQPEAMMQGLQGGIIDAFFMWEPWGSNALAALGDQGIIMADPQLYSYRSLLLARNDFVKTRPEIAAKVMRAMIRAEKDLEDHGPEDLKILSQAINMDDKLLTRLWPDYNYRVDLNPAAIEIMKQNFSYLIKYDENFKDKSVPNYAKFIDSSILKSVAPDRLKN